MLRALSVHRFRNLPDLTWEVGPGSHLVVGRNGVGKTSLLEAVYLAATARSFRTAQLEDLARRESGAPAPADWTLETDEAATDARDPREAPWSPADAPRGWSEAPQDPSNADEAFAQARRSSALVPSPGDGDAVATGDAVGSAHGGPLFAVRADVAGPPQAELAVAWSDRALVRTLDGKTVPLATYLGVLPVVAWTSREDQILAGVPERRRRMIDAGLVAERADRVGLLGRHRRILAHKRELLRRRQHGLEAWNRLLAETGAELARLRAGWVERLSGRLTEALDAAGRGFPAVALRYEPSPPAALDGVEAFFESLGQAAADEIRSGRPCIGPHLDRLSILWGGVDVSRVASAGERKALGLLLVAAQAALVAASGSDPTVLADDVDAELDVEALAAVWRVLAEGRQVLATSSRPEAATHLPGVVEWALDGAEPRGRGRAEGVSEQSLRRRSAGPWRAPGRELLND